MSAMLNSRTVKQSRHATIFDVIALGLLGDSVLGLGAGSIHAYADHDPETRWRNVAPYYIGVLAGIDAIVLLVMLERRSGR